MSHHTVGKYGSFAAAPKPVGVADPYRMSVLRGLGEVEQHLGFRVRGRTRR